MTTSSIEQLAAWAALAPSADNCQPWRMRWTGNGLELHYDLRHPDSNVFDADSHATLLAIGGLAENIDTVLAKNGIRGQWRWSAPGTQPYAQLSLPAALPEVLVQAQSIAQRHTNRLPFAKKTLPVDLVEQVAGETEGRQHVVVLQDRALRKALVKLVRLSSEARFCNRDLHRWLFGSLRETPEQVASGDGLDVATLGLPPGGKSLLGFMSSWPRMARLNRFGFHKLLARAETGLISAAPALVCIVGSAAARDSIDAGRLLTRAWIALNEQGVAVQPYYVITDQVNRLHAGSLPPGFDARVRGVEEALHGLLGLAQDEVLHIILRIGYPKAAPQRSRRLPLSQVFVSAP